MNEKERGSSKISIDNLIIEIFGSVFLGTVLILQKRPLKGMIHSKPSLSIK